MIKNCYDLLMYIKNNNGSLHFPVDTKPVFGISRDVFDIYIDELVSLGYINKYVRSCGITPEGLEYLENN